MLFQPILSQTTDQTNEIDLREFGHSLLGYWRTLALITVCTTGFSLYHVVTAVPEFDSFGTFYLGGDQQNIDSSPDNFLSDYQVVSSVDTQIQLIQSPALIEQAVLETGLNAPITPMGWQPLTYWRWRLLDHRSIAAFAPGPHALIAQFATFADPAAEGGEFELNIEADGHYRLLNLATADGKPEMFLAGVLGRPAAGHGFSVLIKTAAGASPPPAGSVFTLSVEPAKSVADDVAATLDAAADGPAVSPTNVATVAFRWDDPYQATAFVQQLMGDFIQSQLAWKTESASNTQQYIEQQLEKLNASLTQANQNQAAYQSQTGIVDVASNAQADITELSSYQTQRAAALLQQEALQQLVASVARPSGDVNRYLISQANDPVLSGLSTTLATADVKLNSDETQFAPASQEIQQDEAAISRIESTIATVLKNDEAVARQNVQNLDAVIAQYQEHLKSMPAEALQVGQLSRSSEVLGTLYELLMQKEEEAEVSKAAAIEDTRIISPAELPDGASTPKPTITILTGLFTGIFLGLVLIVIQRTFSGCYRTDHDIRRQMALPAYGIIPLRPRKDLKTGVFSAAVTNPFVESFRLLRRNLYGLKADAASQTVLIASAAMGDGRSMLAANIAKALADDGKTVLLVDADLHRGELSMALGHGGVTALAGLAEWIAGLGRPEMHRVEGQKFLLLASGRLPSNPADFINAPRFGEIMAELRAEFECIILDSPAFPIVSDALALMRHADLVLSVVRINHTKRAAFLAHCELFAGPDIRHGMLINGAAQPGFNAAGVYGGGRWSGTPMRRLLGALASFRRKPAIPER